ncbi:MAG: hypothetical protein CSA95_02455 [Bacteroidetes bacterium]|nr:MAG: hypothetical protein CSA95_02455 [Bacteroidota bacterium]
MDKAIHTIFRIISIIFIALGVALIAMVWINGDKALAGDVALQDKILSPFIWMTLIEVVLCAVLAILFPLAFVGQNGRGLVKGLIFVAILAVIGLISYFVLAENTFDAETLQRLKVSADTSRMVGAAIYFSYFLGGAAVLAILYSSVSSMLKR